MKHFLGLDFLWVEKYRVEFVNRPTTIFGTKTIEFLFILVHLLLTNCAGW